MFSPEGHKRAVELYLTTSMTAAEVVEHLGYPTSQCLEHWLAKDPRHAGRMRSPIIPMETRQKAIELVLGGMRQKQAARQLGVGVGAVAHWVNGVSRGRHGRVAAREQECRAQDGGVPSKPRRATPLAMTVTWRRCTAGSGNWSWGTRWCGRCSR